MANEKYVDYFMENTEEDRDETLEILDEVLEELKKLNVHFNKESNVLIGSIFGKTFESILDTLIEFERKQYNSYSIVIAERVAIGYSSTEDEDEEKKGNFMLFIKHLYNNKKYDFSHDTDASGAEACAEFVKNNIHNQIDELKKIAINAKDKIEKDLSVAISQSEVILPIFLVTYSTLISKLSEKRRELNVYEKEINFLNRFYVGVRMTEEERDDVYFRPTIESKLMLKNDSIATAKYE